MKSIQAMYPMLLTLALVVTLGIGVRAQPQTDAHIESSLRQSFVFRHYLRDDNINIRSRQGDVILTGRVSTEYHKTLANDTAAAQGGVHSVDNRLEVDASAPAIASDAWLKGKVKTVLLFHRSVSAVRTEVVAQDGVITLRGDAETQALKDLTADYARDIVGVKSVNNDIAVSGIPSQARLLENNIDDSSVTAEIKMALLFHRSTSAINTRVETNNGTVILRGSAKTTNEKDLAGRIVADLKGVKNLDNRIVVD